MVMLRKYMYLVCPIYKMGFHTFVGEQEEDYRASMAEAVNMMAEDLSYDIRLLLKDR